MESASSAGHSTRRRVLIGGAAALAAGGGLVGVSFARMGSAEAYAKAMAALRAPLGTDADPRQLIRFATLAANSHNTQPWRFRIGNGEIHIVPDLARRTPAVDPDDHHLHTSIGCAAENLAIAATAVGLPGELTRGEQGAAIYSFVRGAARASPLCDAIPKRQSTRAPFEGGTVPPGDLALLRQAASLPGVGVALLTERSQLDGIRDLVVAGNTAQVADRAFVAELKDWLRFNPRAALESGDGIPSAASGNPALPTWLGRRMFDLVFTAEAENAKYVSQLATSSGVAVFVGEQADAEHWQLVGRACQRFALQATALGMKLSFLNQPVEVARFRADLAALVGFPGLRPDLVMRFGYGAPMPMSPRRPVSAVLEV